MDDAGTTIEQSIPAADPPQQRPFQFTLRGLLLVVLAISVLLAVIVPLVRSARREGERVQCGNNLKQIAIALHMYHDTWKCLPPVVITDANGKPMHSWRVLIVPFLESNPWYSYYDMSEPWNGPNNRKLGQQVFHCYRCPSDRRTGREMTNYVAIYGPGTAWNKNKITNFDMIANGDGMSRTILVVEIRNSDIHWMEPRDIHIHDLKLKFNATDGLSLGSYHIEGAMVAMADGSVHILTAEEIAEKLPAMLTIAGNDDSTPDSAAPE